MVDVGVVLCGGLCKWLPTSGVVCPPRFGLSFWCTVIYSFEVIGLWYSPRIGHESVAMMRIVRMVVANCHPTSNKRL